MPAVQASLDRLVFALIRRKADAERVQSSSAERAVEPPVGERRLASRALITEDDHVTALLLPEHPRGALAKSNAEEGMLVSLLDLSTTGCALNHPEPCALLPRQRICLRLRGTELDIELLGTILYVQ